MRCSHLILHSGSCFPGQLSVHASLLVPRVQLHWSSWCQLFFEAKGNKPYQGHDGVNTTTTFDPFKRSFLTGNGKRDGMEVIRVAQQGA